MEEGQKKGLTIEQACKTVGITSRTFLNWRKAPSGDGRLDRRNFVSPRRIADEERKRIVERFCREDVRDLSLTQAFYKLLDENKEYLCSASTLYRIFRAEGLNARRDRTRKPQRRGRPTSYRASRPNEVWTWDITYFRNSRYSGKFFYAYVIIDVYSRAVIRAEVHDADNAEYAAKFLKAAFEKHGIRPGQLVLHSDNGASMKAQSTLAVLAAYGVTFSHSRPRVSNDNPYSESLFRTLKYSGDYRYPQVGFENVAEAQAWLDKFITHYNEVHRHKGIRMVTPMDRFLGKDAEILARRKEAMTEARNRYPQRWVQPDALLNCEMIPDAWLNPENETQSTGRATVESSPESGGEGHKSK